MLCRNWLTIGALLGGLGCTGSMYFPEGDPNAGREALVEWSCHTCHQVAQEDFPKPTVDPPVPVVLGSPMNKKSRAYLAESILAPSHRFARPRATVEFSESPYVYRAETRQYENIKQGSESRMTDYSEVMTLKEWVDIVAYLEARQEAG